MTSLIENCTSREFPSAVDKLNFQSKILSIHSNNHLNYKVHETRDNLQIEKENDVDSGCNESITSPTKSDDASEGKQDSKNDQSEDSKLLRDILQNKEMSIENNNTEETRLPESTERKNSEGHMMKNIISSFSQQDDDRNSLNSDSGDESDYGSSGEPMVNGDDLEGNDMRYDADSASENGLFGQEDSKEAKRARVENILSNMRPASRGSTDQNGIQLQEVRRQKRKQNQPTQHEPNWADPSSPKYRRIEERMALQEQLVKLQQQLHLVQKRYVELYDEDQDGENQTRFSGRDYFVERNFPDRGILDVPKLKDVKFLQHTDKAMQNQPSIFDTLPDSKIPQDNDKKSDKQNIPLQKLDIENLSNSLKNGLSNILNQTVDDIVHKFIEERSAKLLEREREKKRKEEEAMKEAKQREETRQRHPEPHLNSGLPPFRDPFHDLRHDHIGNMARILEKASAFDAPRGLQHDLHRTPHHPLPFPLPFSYFPSQMMHPPSLYSCAPPTITEPEQTEALPLVVGGSTPKKKRTKVTDTRLSPRAARALLGQDPIHLNSAGDVDRHPPTSFSTLIPPVLPTSVAIPNPSLQESNLMRFYRDNAPFSDLSSRNHSPLHGDNYSPSAVPSPADSINTMMKFESIESGSDSYDNPNMHMTSTLTPMHLRKAKLMFFYVRYPSSAILKVYFPDVKFNKNNTAQLVKWFSNFREFFYIQMEKYARQSIAEGCKSVDDLVVTTESELYRVLNLHYNRNNQIEVPDNFRLVVQATLREFYKSVVACKDTEPSWKKSIYKIIARMDDSLPEYFKSPNWMDQLGDM